MDLQLNNKIREAVSLDKSVTLNTTHGVVTMEGILNDKKEELGLMREIEKIDGVKLVISNIKIIKSQ